jgi:hypothetical protein
MRIKLYQINHKRDVYGIHSKGLQEIQNIQRSLGFSGLLSPAIYDEVFSGEVNCKDLAEVSHLFNTNPPPFHRGDYLSVSDIVQVLDAPELVGRIRLHNVAGKSVEMDYTDSEKYNNAIAEAHEDGLEITAVRLAGHHIPSVDNGFYFCEAYGFEKINFDPSKTHQPDNLLRVVAVESGGLIFETKIEDTTEAMRNAIGGRIKISAPFEDESIALISKDVAITDLKGNLYTGNDLFAEPLIVVGDDGNGNFCSLTDEQIQQYLDMFRQSEQSASEDMDENTDSGIHMT